MKTYRVGIIGCGNIFFVHAFPLHSMPNIEIAAVCDIKPDTLQAAKTLFNCDGYSDYREMLKREDIDAVHILTPHYLHAPMAIDAADAGKHILTEKPLTISMQQADEMIEAAKRNNVTLGVISQNRYNSASVVIKNALTDGSLGKIIGQRVIITGIKPQEYYDNSDWRGTWDKEGGALLIDQAIHTMDMARWFIDEDIISVEASIANRAHPGIETEDTAEGLITYASGIQCVFFASNNFTFNSPIVIETQCENGIALMEFDSAVITYKNGKEIKVVNDPTEFLNEQDIKDFFNRESREIAMETLDAWGVLLPPILWKGSPSHWGVTHDKQIRNFYDSLDAGVQPDVSGEEAYKSTKLILSIYQSAKENSRITF